MGEGGEEEGESVARRCMQGFVGERREGGGGRGRTEYATAREATTARQGQQL